MMDNKQRQKETMKNAKKVAGKMYDPSDYDNSEKQDMGMAITHEQVSDGYMEGTVDGKIDEIDQDDNLKSHNGKALRRKGFEE